MNNMQWGGGYGPVNADYSGHAFWFAHAPFLLAIFAPIILIVVLWSIFWKGLALWHSARRGSYWWFIIMLVVNTVGILEIIYLFGVARVGWKGLFSTQEHHHN